MAIKPHRRHRNTLASSVSVRQSERGRSVRVLGYSFRRAAEAARVRQTIIEQYGIRPTDARVADLAGDGVVLGVRAREDNLEELSRILAEHGGEPLVGVDERWTGLPPPD